MGPASFQDGILKFCMMALFALTILAIQNLDNWANPPVNDPDKTIPKTLNKESAILWALENNPELAVFRRQRGIASAGVVIAEAYPFNPIWEGKVRGDGGPAEAGITNRVPTEHGLLTELEVRGQGSYRRESANAELARTDWEIAHQEILLSVRVARAFDGMLYRHAKIDLLRQTIDLDQHTLELVRKLVTQGRLHGPDEIVARGELDDVRAQLAPAQANLETARYELRRALGIVDQHSKLEGKLEASLLAWPETALMPVALDRRADRRARQAAVTEAEARLQLQRSNRFGNPILGPHYEYDNTRVSYVGVQFALPLPVLNTHRGDILQREAELERARLELVQTEVGIRQDVQSALARLDRANASVYTYRNENLPHQENSVKQIEKFLDSGDPNVTVIHVIETRRKLLKARDGLLDALWELRQARADLAAAIGDPALAVLNWNPEEEKKAAPKPVKQ
jgi:cobalt-zinc-cadmium efflux system outer membrane protein